MRFYRDAVLETPIEWYFVPDDRETMPFAHAFGSQIYDRDDEPAGPIGERYAPVPWAGGVPPRIVSAGGLCGSQFQWENGASIDDPLPALWPTTKIGKCCKEPLKLGIGGHADGRVPGACAFPLFECPGLEVGPALVLEVTSSLGVPVCPGILGSFLLVCDAKEHAWVSEYEINGQKVRWKLDYRISEPTGFRLRFESENNFTQGGCFVQACEPFHLHGVLLFGPAFFPIVCAGGVTGAFLDCDMFEP